MTGWERVHAGGILWRCYAGGASESPPLVILHGLFGAGDNWQSQARALATGDGDEGGSVARTVLVPDLPDHGDSLHTDSFTYPAIAQLLWDVLPRVPASFPVELLGHSMGGKIGMAMALQRPDRVSRLVVVDIAPVRYPSRHREILEGMQAVAEAAPASRSRAEQILAPYVPEKAVRLFLLKSLVPRDDSRDAYGWKLNLEGIRRCYDSISDWPFDPATTTAFQGPTLFIRGGRSPYIEESGEEKIRAFFPRAVIRTIQGAGHWVHAEARETFLSVVRGADS
ncbi:MAG: alpha/beta fold hydrolase [Spirochaetaceae bacterium]|nr:MAG: alpha/beta fold hydrolase [Spirochaetaceae bacterium]